MVVNKLKWVGEGKTLVATLPVYLNALTGKGVHVVTVNDYLAKRDSEDMGRIYKALGLTVGLIVHDMNPHERRAAYMADVTYGTNNEFGFDYLRDNMVVNVDQMAISFSNACIHAKSLQSCPTLCNPMDSSPPHSSVHGIL